MDIRQNRSWMYDKLMSNRRGYMLAPMLSM